MYNNIIIVVCIWYLGIDISQLDIDLLIVKSAKSQYNHSTSANLVGFVSNMTNRNHMKS